MITPEDLYNKTNGGLDIIKDYFPHAPNYLTDKKPFKMHSENTPSAHLKNIKGIWRITDFGDDSVAKSAIDLVMIEERLGFKETLYKLAGKYNLTDDLKEDVNKPEFEYRTAKDDELDGDFSFICNDIMTDLELKVLGPVVKQDTVKALNYSSLKSYQTIKNRKVTTVKSTADYPIFIRECAFINKDLEREVFHKIYQPYSFDRGLRFFSKGNKPADYINGLAELEKAYMDYTKVQEKEFNADPRNEDKRFEPKKLAEAFICSGERDSICCKAMGYFPLWFNSETSKMTEYQYATIMKYVYKLYNVPDLDKTGIKNGVELAMQFMDIYTVWLPDWLSTYSSHGKPRKDLRDFVEIRPAFKDFNNLVKVAMPMRFWETKYSKEGPRQEINTEYVYHFLRLNGFGTMENKNSKSGQMFVLSQNNIVKEVKAKHVRAYLRDFLEKNYIDIEIRNLVNNTTRLSESSLENLKDMKIDFSDYDRSRQFFFFENLTLEVLENDIKAHKPKDIDRSVWDDEVIKHQVKRTSKAFVISQDAGEYDISVNHTDSKFFSFLINASRVHWRKEYEERITSFSEGKDAYVKANKFNICGPLLTELEQDEQKLHLINKIFTIGYLLHRYKDPHRAWCVFAMDNVIGEVGDSNGRSGKSFCYKALRNFMKSVTLSGRNPKLTENPHIYDRITEYTDLVIVDDSHEYLDFNFFFDVVTGDMPVNPKNNQSYEIQFEKAPKFVITSNYTLRKIDPSTEGRILYSVFSDYYHQKTDQNNYQETRSIFDDFASNLMMDDYSEENWNHDFNFFADCCQFYLSTISNKDFVKLQPPMDNVTNRNLLTQMGENFDDWASVYFSAEGGNVNKLLSKNECLKHFIDKANVKNWTTQKFTKSLKAFCSRHKDYIIRLNPDEYKNPQGRIIRKHEGEACEMIYIQTTTELDFTQVVNIKEDDKPF